ncbi:MAG: DUF2244 domain-containing protein [Pseudomonadota bacterium]
MIDVDRNPEHPDFEIVELKSNLSISLDRLFAVFLGLSTVTLLVAIGPLIVGLWPVMAVALFHLLLVGLCLRLAWRGHWARESISIGPDVIRVERFVQGGSSLREWPLAWVRVRVENGKLGERRVFLTCQGKREEVGAFLPIDERLEVAQQLKTRIGPLTAWSK